MSERSALDLFQKEIQHEIQLSLDYLKSGSCVDFLDYKVHTTRIRSLDDSLILLKQSIKTALNSNEED